MGALTILFMHLSLKKHLTESLAVYSSQTFFALFCQRHSQKRFHLKMQGGMGSLQLSAPRRGQKQSK